MSLGMNWFESILYGFVLGITEILPVSAQAHETLLLKFLGTSPSPLLRLLVHAAIWEALYLTLREPIDQMLRERELARIPPRRRNRQPDPQVLFDLRLVQTALVPVLLGFFLYPVMKSWQSDLSKLALFLLCNGVVLYIPRYLPSGNKDSRSMTRLDGLLLGVSGFLGMIPGLSRLGNVSTAALSRGADRQHTLRWCLLILLAAMLGVCVMDAWALYQAGAGVVDLTTVLSVCLGALAAFGGAWAGIKILGFLAVRAGFGAFGTYSLGAALFTFILYLTV